MLEEEVGLMEEYGDIINYLRHVVYMVEASSHERKKLRHLAQPYVIRRESLYYIRKDSIQRQVVTRSEIPEIFSHYYDDSCSDHFAFKATSRKILIVNYYWSFLFGNTEHYCSTFKVC